MAKQLEKNGGDITFSELEEILVKYAEGGIDGIIKDDEGSITGIKVEGVTDVIPREEIYAGGFGEEVKLNQTSATIQLGETLQLTATVLPETITNKEVSWSSSNEEIATVDENGLVTAKDKIGTVIITAKTKNGSNKTGTCTITVERIVNAEDIANITGNMYLGKTVTNYTSTTSGVDSWQIFYAGNEFSTDGSYHIYLISSNHIPYSSVPKTYSGSVAMTAGTYSACAYWNSNVLAKYSSGIGNVDATGKKYISSYSPSTVYDNMKAVAYMLDTNTWSGFKDSTATGYAEYAVGGPSVEMLFRSHNKKNKTSFEYQASGTGYQIRKTSNDSYTKYVDSMISTSESLYVVPASDSTSEYSAWWLASPSLYGSNYVMYVRIPGLVGYNPYDTNIIGFRPLVCLTTNVEIKEQLDGTFTIM